MRYMEIKKYDISNGPGVRVSVFASGCHHHCEGCFNSIAWDFKSGKEFTQEVFNEVLDALNHEYITGLSLLGGEPFELVNVKGFLPLVKKVKEYILIKLFGHTQVIYLIKKYWMIFVKRVRRWKSLLNI